MQQFPRMRSAKRSSRFLPRLGRLGRTGVGWLSLALFSTSLVGYILHMGAVGHTICADHGELIEGSVGAAVVDAHAEEAAQEPGGEAHEHCPIAVAVSASAIARLDHVFLVDPLPAIVRRPVAVTEPIDVLAVAPKTSPPA